MWPSESSVFHGNSPSHICCADTLRCKFQNASATLDVPNADTLPFAYEFGSNSVEAADILRMPQSVWKSGDASASSTSPFCSSVHTCCDKRSVGRGLWLLMRFADALCPCSQ